MREANASESIRRTNKISTTLANKNSRLADLLTASTRQGRLWAKQVLETRARTVPTVRKVWADGGYSGPLVKGYAAAVPCEVEIVSRPPDANGFILFKTKMGS